MCLLFTVSSLSTGIIMYKKMFCGKLNLSHCCSFYGTVVKILSIKCFVSSTFCWLRPSILTFFFETLSLKYVGVTSTLMFCDVIGHVTILFAVFDFLQVIYWSSKINNSGSLSVRRASYPGRAVPDLLLRNPAGAGFCRICKANPARAGAGFQDFTI